MSDHPFGVPQLEPFDLEADGKTIAMATIGYLQLTLRPPGTVPTAEQATAVMADVRAALLAGTKACSEVSRLRTDLTSLRDTHRPKPHADPTKAGALCAACSVHGSIVAWPCATWSAAERILTHRKA
ncbi:hypothetical protein ABZT17_26905 [Streptomyces sp. NPDC005648]|uniref:hypothetical protein n=1 Tax=Streptomyces sp. NPDC005648 TaxID=3157044 RepID=UPI0033A2BD7F